MLFKKKQKKNKKNLGLNFRGKKKKTFMSLVQRSKSKNKFLLKCKYDLTAFLVHPSNGSTSHWKQNLNSSPWFTRPNLSWPHSPLLRLPWLLSPYRERNWRCPGPLHSLFSLPRAGFSSLSSSVTCVEEPVLTTSSTGVGHSINSIVAFWIFILWNFLHCHYLFACLVSSNGLYLPWSQKQVCPVHQRQ